MLVTLALLFSPLLDLCEKAELKSRASTPPFLLQNDPTSLSTRADTLWKSLAQKLIAEVQKKHREIGHTLIERSKKSTAPLEPSDSPESLNSDTLRTQSVYGLLPEVHVDRGHGAIFPAAPQAPHAHSWFDLARSAASILKRQRALESDLSTTPLTDLARSFAGLHQAIETLASQTRHVETWNQRLLIHWQAHRSEGKVPRAHQVIQSLRTDPGNRSEEIEGLREQLRPHRVLKRAFLPDRLPSSIGAKQQTLILPIATDIRDRRFLKEVEGALDTYWNQSPWARRQHIAFKIQWRMVQPNPKFASAEITIQEHIQTFPKDHVVITTGGLTAHVMSHAMILGPGKIDGRTLGHELGHLIGFEDCYLRTLSAQGFAGWKGNAVLEWNNPFFPDDLMCDNTVGIARAVQW